MPIRNHYPGAGHGGRSRATGSHGTRGRTNGDHVNGNRSANGLVNGDGVDGGYINGNFTIQRALDIARNSEEVLDPTILHYLERALQDVWARLQAAPDTYVMDRDEFSLFNYFRQRFATSPIAQSAVQRFWDNYHGDPNHPDSMANNASP